MANINMTRPQITEAESIPKMTSDIADFVKNTLLRLYADQVGVKLKDLDVSIKKKEEPA